MNDIIKGLVNDLREEAEYRSTEPSLVKLCTDAANVIEELEKREKTLLIAIDNLANDIENIKEGITSADCMGDISKFIRRQGWDNE